MRVGPILLTGGTGQVGGYALPLLCQLGEVVAPDRSGLDLRSEASIREVIRRVRPRWIVNSGAYTAVDKAETDREAAFAINAVAPRILGEEAAKLGTPVLHFSTDYVFSGEGTAPWNEEDPTNPRNVYGESKLAGEGALAASGAPYLIFRTSWVYGAMGKNFLLTILRFAREREELRIVGDQTGSPTSAASLANLIVHVIRHCDEESRVRDLPLLQIVDQLSGVYHAADGGFTTWHGFAEEFIRIAQEAAPGQSFARLTPIITADFPTPALRPLNSRMSTNRLKALLHHTMPRWQDATADVMRQVLTETEEAASFRAATDVPQEG